MLCSALSHLLPPVMFGITVLQTHSVTFRDQSMIRFSGLLRNTVLHAGRGGRHNEQILKTEYIRRQEKSCFKYHRLICQVPIGNCTSSRNGQWMVYECHTAFMWFLNYFRNH